MESLNKDNKSIDTAFYLCYCLGILLPKGFPSYESKISLMSNTTKEEYPIYDIVKDDDGNIKIIIDD